MKRKIEPKLWFFAKELHNKRERERERE